MEDFLGPFWSKYLGSFWHHFLGSNRNIKGVVLGFARAVLLSQRGHNGHKRKWPHQQWPHEKSQFGPFAGHLVPFQILYGRQCSLTNWENCYKCILFTWECFVWHLSCNMQQKEKQKTKNREKLWRHGFSSMLLLHRHLNVPLLQGINKCDDTNLGLPPTQTQECFL